MKRAKQLSFIPNHKTNQRFFGGSLLIGRRKTPRPVNVKEPIHIVMRSQYAHGPRSFRSSKNIKRIERILERAALKYHIKIYRKAIQSNHIHLVVKISSKVSYKAFIAVVAGKIASYSMSQMSFKNFLHFLDETQSFDWGEGYKTPHKGQAFWDCRPFTRILYWGKDYQKACKYLLRNNLEALGFIKYQPRRKNYAYKRYLNPPISKARSIKNIEIYMNHLKY